ncbi:hypothetical protein SETIT_5G108000v2 [Setaria italica]|uniref:DUF674 domain-containing protein n=1 Tax=Setaria italica TaxID=4555 RepID=K3XT52_SETIT|nr:uncharacterized protein LOC101762481 [Setaria italica]RCV24716.1 hypothetical protein SETIT_5G108000v2 [Setaria italica]
MATAAALRMKLLIDKKAQRVLFAEASKDVVDFLFSLLAMPIATAVKLLGKESMVGCVGNLYASVDKLESIYVQNGASKDALLCPTVLSSSNSLLCLPEKSLYTNTGHANCGLYITARRGSACLTCYSGMTAAAQVLPAAAHGFVLGIVTFMVKDDLSVTSMSAVSTLLNTFAVRDVGDLQEKTVQLGYNEGLAILKASLQSKTVLTDVFLGDKKAPVLAA